MTAVPRIPLEPDPAEIAEFCGVIFDHCEGWVAVRSLREKGCADAAPRTECHRAGERLPDAIAAAARRAAADNRGCYVVPCTVGRNGSARNEDLIATAVVPVDLDEGDIAAKRDHLVRHLGPPALLVASGGRTDEGQDKLHLYWQLAEAAREADLRKVADLRAEIARKVGGDAAFARLTQPIRVAGSIHGKHGVPRLVTILERADRKWSLEELVEAVSGMPALAGCADAETTRASAARPCSVRDLMSRPVRQAGADGITRHDALSRVIGHWLRQARLGGLSLEEAWQAVVDHNATLIRPPWPQERLRREFDALLVLDVERHGQSIGSVDRSTGSAPPEFSEDALAAEFVASQGCDWHHVAPWGRWLRWNGVRWAFDETGRAREAMRLLCRRMAGRADGNLARRIASDRTITAVARIAASDALIAMAPESCDPDPMLLNTPAGVVDLATSELHPHTREDHMTQVTGASPGTGCPLWEEFLKEITGEDADLVAYLRRLCGYCLTGLTTEQVFGFLHGHGANGKSVFLRVLSAILGSYAKTAPLDSFTATRSTNHPTDLAGLRGARLVTVNETEAGRTWAESRIKAITGGDRISARFMRCDFFEFEPTFKLLVAGNHRPRLVGVGEAMRRRLHLVPFNVTIPTDRRDPRLAERLLAERDGILGWMLEGCAEWQRLGLAPPASVSEAANSYFEDEDLVGQWIEACCVVGPEERATAAALFSSWSAFAEAGGHEKGTARSLGEALAARNFERFHTRSARGWRGIDLRSSGRAG